MFIWILSLKKDTSTLCFLIIQKALLNFCCYCLKLYLSTVIWMDSSSGQNLLLYRTSGVICSVIRLPIIRHRSPDTLCPWDGMATDSSTSIALSAVGVVTSSIFLVWWEQHLRILMRHCLFLSIWTCTIYTNKSTACIKTHLCTWYIEFFVIIYMQKNIRKKMKLYFNSFMEGKCTCVPKGINN